MAGSTSNLDLIETSQAQKEVTANALFDAASSSLTFGRRASTCAALTWGYYGGAAMIAGVPTLVVNGSIALTASATNYVELRVADAVVVNNTVDWTGAGYTALYKVVTGAATVTTYEDYRALVGPAGPQGATGATGATGETGATGATGAMSVWYNGTGVPSDATGTNGDYYVNTANGDYYTKAAGTWGSAIGNLALPTTQPFDVHAFYPGIPTASAVILRVPLARAVDFVANFAGSYFAGSANATASTIFDVQKNGTSIGTVTIAAGTTTATFATSGGAAQSFVAGDVLFIIAPATPDATLADPGFVLAGTR